MSNSPNPYSRNYRYGGYGSPVTTAGEQATLLQRVAYLLATALLVTAGGAYLSRDWSPALGLPLMLGAFACVIGLNFARRNLSLSVVLLYALSLMEGLALGPLLMTVARGYTHGAAIITEASVLSAVIMGGLGSYVWISNKDFGGIGKFLMYGLLAVIVVSIVSLFWHTLAMMGQFQMILSLAVVALFVGFTLYDVSNLKYRYGANDYVIATVQLYLDFLNLFLALLRILMILAGGNGGSRR